MQKIDRLGWAAGVCVSAFGRRIGIRTDKPEVLNRILDCLPPGATPCPPPYVDHLYSLKVGGAGSRPSSRQFTLLYAGLTRLARTMNLDEALAELTESIEQYVAFYAANRVFLHAGVVGWKGRAIVLPGRTFAGKSTLVAALLRAGATYYSDEFAVLDPDGQVHPYARPLALRKQDGQPDGKRPPGYFGGRAGEAPLDVGLIAFLEYRKGAAETIQQVSAARAAMQLVPYAYCATAEPERAVLTIAQAVRKSRILRGKRGEADAMARRLMHLVEDADGA